MDASPVVAPPSSETRVDVSSLSGLRVALVHDWLTGRRGGEKCLEVFCRLFPTATVHTLLHKPGSVGETIGAMTIRTSALQRIPNVDRHYRHFLPVMPLAAAGWNVGEVDLVISLSHCVAKAVRVPAGVPHVCYCFTPMRYAWEGREAYLESWRDRPVRRAVAGAILDRLRAWDRAAARRVTHFVSISETIRRRIELCYDRSSHVIQPPVDTHFYTPDGGPRDEDYLCVSALVPYKRIDQAIAACRASGRRLTIIGEGPERARLERSAGDGTRFLGWQPDEVIREHYRRCRALLFPGDEDFGIVPIEALACGMPVIALDRGGVAETVQPPFGRLYAEATAEGLAGAIESWEADGRPHDDDAARREAERFAPAVYRDRLTAFLSDVVGQARRDGVPPKPHIAASRSRRRSRPSGKKTV
jgi:glycosyltransferase involved in cell wall biosynthesis